MKRKRVVVLGATGSIGESAAKVARDIPERVEIVGIAANSKARELAAQANELRPAAVCIVDETKLSELRANLKYEPEIFAGETGLREIASTVAKRHGFGRNCWDRWFASRAGCNRSGERSGRCEQGDFSDGGRDCDAESARKRVQVLPVDSEHNAIFQCLQSGRGLSGPNSRSAEAAPTFQSTDIRRIILTASGGPFRETPAEKFSTITVEQALKHPTWNMGQKITIDSATLFNKGLEMIEAHWLFGVEMAQVEVVIHPQSIVHSMVEFADGSVLAQLSHSNMCFPIQYAITWPDRVPNSLPPLDFGKLAE